MIENTDLDKSQVYEHIDNDILKFLKSRGTIKAALLHKLENYFCHPKSKYNISKDDLLFKLFNMMRDRVIDIIIPEIFKVKWKKYFLSDLKFLRDGNYFCRIFTNYKSKFLQKQNLNDYYFDSRKIDFNDQALLSELIQHLILLSRKIRDLNKKIIVFYPVNSNPIDIYEKNFEGEYYLRSIDFKTEKKESQDIKIEIPLEEQAESVSIIKAYRSSYMCFYIPLIESILKVIEYLQKEKDSINNYEDILYNYSRKFAYQCIEFVRSDYVEINEPNPYRWETFFKFFNIDIKILEYDFKSIKFHGRTFETCCNLKYCIFIENKFKEVIRKLKKLGYMEFPEENYDEKIAIGFDLDYFIPYCTIEQIYFVSKYICYYQTFLLFYHAFEYIKESNPSTKFTEKEQKLFKIFSPVMQLLFGIPDDDSFYNKLVFKYYTYDSNELEVIYNKFLLKHVKFIEKKMFRYFFIKYGRQKN